MSIPDFLLTTIIQPYYFEIFYNINISPRFYKYLVYNIEIIQDFQKEIEIQNNPPKKALPKLKKLLNDFLKNNGIIFSKIGSNNIMLVPENNSIEKYIYSRNHDLVYNCQISKEDLINPYLFDDMIDYHYITYLSDTKEIKKFGEKLNSSNSKI